VPWSHPAYEALADLVARHAGLAFPAPRTDLAEVGMRRAMTRAGVPHPEEYRALVAVNPQALDDLIVELTVGETYFFREPAQFRFIRREVFPEWRRRRGERGTVRVWSCGCASGEEPYSLAILLEEEGFGERTFLLASDISRAALARARQARFGAWSLRGEGLASAQAYLRRLGPVYILDERIRRRARFEPLNLAQDIYPSATNGTWGMDLILCRNVLIYFARDAVRAVARRLYESLAPGGLLITASSDPPLAGEAPFETVVTADGVFYRRPQPLSLCAATDSSFRAPERETMNPSPRTDSQTAAINPAPYQPCLPPPPLPFGNDEVAVPVSPGLIRPEEPDDPVAEARRELAQGNYARACELTRGLAEDGQASVIHVRALANGEPAEAEKTCTAAVGRHPLSVELRYLHAVLLLGLRREEEAIRALRRVLYLDRTLAVAHFTLGTLLEQRGDGAGAARSYRNARDLCAGRPADEEVPLSEGERAGVLAQAAAARLALVEAPGGDA
jgi:chemotaxis protein methyltransferase CheR